MTAASPPPPVEIEFFFDLSSPWTCLAFHNIRRLAAETGAHMIWRPFLVGGVFNAVNASVYAGRADPDSPKVRRNFHWLREWAALAGVPMNFPSPHHPIRSVAAMRMACALEDRQDDLLRFAKAAFDACYTDQRNLDDPAELVAIADACGLDGATLATQSASQPAKDRLRANTDEAIARGAFGSPTIFVDGTDMYFGNDQLPIVRTRIMALQNEARSASQTQTPA
jgi:2-hydroxychromene-2-carboxylate isomerase